MSQWIWKFGEFEVYHNLLLHNRREQYGYRKPSMWKLYSPDTVVRFRKTVTTAGGEFRVTACGYFDVTVGSDYRSMKKYGGQPLIPLPAGTVEITIVVSNPDAFPCLYVDGVISSDDTWTADDLTADCAPVGTHPHFNAPDILPTLFPFQYEEIRYMAKEVVPDGVLFDFGRETFARVAVTVPNDTTLTVVYGESREEALDREWSVIHLTQDTVHCVLRLAPRAFRYLFVDNPAAEVLAEYEYLPLEQRGSFHCDEDIVNTVWDTAAYTFHLNSREFFLDGIKRDRWVWSADAYQCLFVNRYLFFDKDIEQRTLIALGGKPPMKAHINTIMDYSFFWIISLYEHYTTYGDRNFLEQIAPQMKEIMDFCRRRADSDGFVREQPGDWIFIDWAPMDKTGALCGEQILFAKALECYALLCDVIHADSAGSSQQATALQTSILEHFYDNELGAFVDSYESGQRNVTRHSNILAYLFMPLSDTVKAGIYRDVILNDAVRQITTPYFKFYENQVHCEAGNPHLLETSIREYYGSMLETGATTLYEEYDPTMTGTQHYAMYGNPYEKSLCHAWSASPIYLLGRYRLGVKNIGIAYDSFEVRPMPGNLRTFSGTVPVPGGSVRVEVTDSSVTALSTVAGGTFIVGEQSLPLPPNKSVTLSLF
ncbi:hypothetical protein LJC63_05625 [Ruminococcaceae bacterium OttesenSCG-928-L11]|nr:hypothetical protein [Ruminococcaceae bacterium OttesenSCG-928-L11]